MRHTPAVAETRADPGRVLLPGSPEWPSALDELGPGAPPERLFAAGSPIPAGAPAVAVVGTRRPTATGLDVASEIAGALGEAGWVVVSGLAVGIDAAHRGALGAGGHTVAVLGCGLDVRYPQHNLDLKEEIAAGGTLVTEYEPGTPPLPRNFPLRNRIIAGLSLGVVVVEGGIHSGALVTARLALDANRSVYAVPGSVRNPMAAGPNELIRTSGAALVTEARHVFEDLAPGLVWHGRNGTASASGPPPSLDRRDLEVLAALDDVAAPLDRIAELAGGPTGAVAATLSRLEVRGLTARHSGGYAVTASGAKARCAAGPTSR